MITASQPAPPPLPNKAPGAFTVNQDPVAAMPVAAVPVAPAAAMTGDPYTFASEPKALMAQRKMYKDQPMGQQQQQQIQKGDQKKPVMGNMMYDRRIYRGNTYASPVIPLYAQPDPVELERQREKKRRARAKKRLKFLQQQRANLTPEPVQGRKHIEVQTELYLEELSDKVPEAIAATQTDAFLDRAPSPLYIPQKSGLDVATQVYEGELFDFDFEVEPILEVLTGKTIEQALMEVMEEEELEALRKHQLAFEERRNAELAEVQRMEDAERRRTEEKERRAAEQLRILKEKQEVAEKIAARAFAQSYLHNLVPTAFDYLTTNGFFYDNVEREIETLFLPWLTESVDKTLDRMQVSRLVLDDIIKTSVKKLQQAHRASAVPE
ncbi:Radial spoke head protein 3 [Quaeritorhiza haematococci]|nr:Radial spoke head protein 3 [Quaeritorhiza haematococci]